MVDIGLNDVRLTSYGRISAISDDSTSNCLALMGMFTVGTGVPTNSPPPAAILTGIKTNTVFWPIVCQPFFIGDGLTGTGAGQQQVFHVPDNATELFLGYADGSSFQGKPGDYGDNLGELSVTYSILASPMLSVSSDCTNCVTLCWNTATNGTYQLQCQSAVSLNAWLNLGPPIPGDGLSHCYGDTNSRQANRFYRVAVTP